MKLKIEPPAGPFMAGGAMPVKLTLQNTGTAPVMTPSPERQSPFEYQLQNQTGDTVASFSAVMRDALLQGGAVPPDAPDHELAPGEAQTYQDDLSRHWLKPIPPGRYTLQAGVSTGAGRARSESVPLTILAPNIMNATVSLDRGRRHTVAVQVIRNEGGKTIIQGSFSPNGHPELSAFQSFEDAVVGDAVPSLCLAEEARPSPNWRWAAWVNEGRLAGIMTRPYDARYAFSDFDTGLAEPEILAGFQNEKGLASFVLAGLTGGHKTIRLFHIQGVDQFKLTESGLEMPQDAAPQVCGELAGDNLQLKIFWQTESTQLSACQIDGATGEWIQPAAGLWQSARPILAFRVPRLNRSENDRGWVVLAHDPAKEPSPPGLFQFVLERGGALGPELKLPSPPEPFQEWYLPGHETTPTPIGGRGREQFFVTRAGQSSQWIALSGVPASAAGLQIFGLANGQSWLMYHAPETGLVFRTLD